MSKRKSSHTTSAVKLQRLLPCLKINNCNCRHNIMFIFNVIIVAAILNLCSGLQHQQPQQQLDGRQFYQNQHHLQIQAQRSSSSASAPSSPLQLAKQWKLFTYNFLSNAPVTDTNFYNPLNILATGIAITEDRIIIATPKLFSGVPSTLNWVSRSDYEDSPVLQPYPDWSFATTGRTDFNCSDLGLVSVYRVRIDSCNRLWVLDAGISRSLEDYEKTCPPKILVFDLKTNQVVRRIDFPRGVLRGESLFTNLIVDETTAKAGTCDDVFVYISDTVEPAIVVYDSIRDTTWRVTHPAMYPDPDFAESEILGQRFVLMDGIVGITFDAPKGLIYFQPFATDRIFSVTREVLRAGPIAINQVLPSVKLVGKKSSQGIGMCVTPDGTLLFSPATETAVASYNPATNEQRILAQDKEHLQFVADIILTPNDPGYIYMISSKFHRYFLKNLNAQEVNNRILRIPLPGYVAPSAHALVPSTGYSAHPYNLPTNYNSFYQLTNSIQQKSSNFIPSTASSGLFSRPSTVSSHPYSFENSGIINYNDKNPFNALNQGESFPPRKELRNQDKYSFLESLAATTTADRPAPHDAILNLHTGGDGYYYARPARSTKQQETSAKTNKK